MSTKGAPPVIKSEHGLCRGSAPNFIFSAASHQMQLAFVMMVLLQLAELKLL